MSNNLYGPQLRSVLLWKFVRHLQGTCIVHTAIHNNILRWIDMHLEICGAAIKYKKKKENLKVNGVMSVFNSCITKSDGHSIWVLDMVEPKCIKRKHWTMNSNQINQSVEMILFLSLKKKSNTHYARNNCNSINAAELWAWAERIYSIS